MNQIKIIFGLVIILLVGSIGEASETWDIGEAPPLFRNYFVEKHPTPNEIPQIFNKNGRKDWAAIIDSVWGYGDSDQEKLNEWHTYWITMDDSLAVFPGLSENFWDSIFTPAIWSSKHRCSVFLRRCTPAFSLAPLMTGISSPIFMNGCHQPQSDS